MKTKLTYVVEFNNTHDNFLYCICHKENKDVYGIEMYPVKVLKNETNANLLVGDILLIVQY